MKIFFFTFSITKLSFFPTQLQHCLSNTSLYLFILLLAEIFCSLLFQMNLDIYTMAWKQRENSWIVKITDWKLLIGIPVMFLLVNLGMRKGWILELLH